MTPPHGLAPQFASDNWSGICPEALEALVRANAGHAPAYGGDDWTAAATQAIRDAFATDCDVFLVFNGTAANSVGLAAMVRNTDAIVCSGHAHILVDECGAPHLFSGGARLLPVDVPHARLTPEAIATVSGTPHDVHSARPRAVSLTQATELGTVYAPDEIRAIATFAHERGMRVHMDGARLANAIASLGCAPADVTWRAGVDALSFGGTKNGLPFGEAIVFFDRALGEEFGRRRMQAGQLASKMRFLAAPWLGALADGAWLRHAAHANAMARRMRDALHGIPGTRLLAPVEANGVFVDVPLAVIAGLRERGWQFYEFVGDTGIRLMMSWDTPASAVDAFASDLRELAAAGAPR